MGEVRLIETEWSGRPNKTEHLSSIIRKDNEEKIWGLSSSRGYSKYQGAGTGTSLTFKEAGVATGQKQEGKQKGMNAKVEAKAVFSGL